MTKVKVTRPLSGEGARKRGEWPAVVFFWAFGLAIMSYSVARLVLDGKPHPYHWLAAVVGALAGIPLGWLWFRWRGDVF